jgi:hypothetical protein
MRTDQTFTTGGEEVVLAVSLELAAAKWKVALHDGRREKHRRRGDAHCWRRRSSRRTTAWLLRTTDDIFWRQKRHDDCTRRNLRPSALRHGL